MFWVFKLDRILSGGTTSSYVIGGITQIGSFDWDRILFTVQEHLSSYS